MFLNYPFLIFIILIVTYINIIFAFMGFLILFKFIMNKWIKEMETNKWNNTYIIHVVNNLDRRTPLMRTIITSVYRNKTLSISLLAYWTSLLFELLKIIKPISQLQRTDNSYAFFIKPYLRFKKVTYIYIGCISHIIYNPCYLSPPFFFLIWKL